MMYLRKFQGGAISCLMALTLAFTAGYAGQALASEERQPASPYMSIDDLNLPETVDQVIVVAGDGDGAGKVTVFCYQKERPDDGQEAGKAKNTGITEVTAWKEVFRVPGVYGKNGATANKKEGDKKTPLGVYSFTMAFGLKEDPGSILPYHQIQSGDYWVDDSESSHYNRLVNTSDTKKDWKSAENMAAQSPYYNYGLALNYNTECVPGKGSAIFLHCTGQESDTGSAGCVRIPEENVKGLVQSADENTRIVIVSDLSQLKKDGQ